MGKKILPVTSNQSDAVRDMANEKGVGRPNWQKGHDKGDFSNLLDRLKMEGLANAHGARIHIVRSWVRQGRPWDEAINAAGPNTPVDYSVRKVGSLYLPTGTIEEEQEHVLLNYLKGDGSWDKALALGKKAKLLPTVPREVFAHGEQHPYLHHLLGINEMYVIATTECTFEGGRRACFVWWDGSGCEARLDCVGYFGSVAGWFAFRKPSASDFKP